MPRQLLSADGRVLEHDDSRIVLGRSPRNRSGADDPDADTAEVYGVPISSAWTDLLDLARAASQVAGIQSATNMAAAEIQHIVSIIGKIREASGSIAAAVEEQSSATTQISRAAQEAASGTDHLRETVREVLGKANTAESVAENTGAKSDILNHRFDDLNQTANDFVQSLRAAR
jgi:methyl-accepting chemotaxis protein